MYNILSLWALVLMLAGCAPASRPLTADEQVTLDAMVDRIPMVTETMAVLVGEVDQPFDASGEVSDAETMAKDIKTTANRIPDYVRNDQVLAYDEESNFGGEIAGAETSDTTDDVMYLNPEEPYWHLGLLGHEAGHVDFGPHSDEIKFTLDAYAAGDLTPEEEVDFEVSTIEVRDYSFGGGDILSLLDLPIARELDEIDRKIASSRDEYEKGVWTAEEALTHALTPPSSDAEDFAERERVAVDSTHGHVMDVLGIEQSTLERILAESPFYDYLVEQQDERVHAQLSDLFED